MGPLDARAVLAPLNLEQKGPRALYAAMNWLMYYSAPETLAQILDLPEPVARAMLLRVEGCGRKTAERVLEAIREHKGAMDNDAHEVAKDRIERALLAHLRSTAQAISDARDLGQPTDEMFALRDAERDLVQGLLTALRAA